VASKNISISPVGLVRAEWVGTYKPSMGMNSFPLANPEQGALCVYENGTILYTGTWGAKWETTLAQVKNARSASVVAPHVPSDRGIRTTFGSLDRTVVFSGNKPGVTLNLVDNVAGHLPTHATFGLGKIYVAAKIGWVQRGRTERARQSCTSWLRLLTSKVTLEAFHESFVAESSLWKEFPYGLEV
jgi:hypothetical protein